VRRATVVSLVALVTIAALVAVTLVVGTRVLLDRAPADPAPAEATSGAEPPPGVPDDAEVAIVDGVVDGDTIRILVDDGVERVRLLNVDAPEARHPERGRECGAGTATAMVEEVLPPGATAWLSPGRRDRDRFGRLLRYAWTVDGRDVQAMLVDAGYARVLVVAGDDRYAEDLRPLEDAARADGRGTWGPGCPD
jgi:endonuclease YncB( thermonuclease family)